MSISEISPFGLPQSLNYQEMLPSIPDSCTSYSVNIAPAGLTVVTGATIDNTGSPTFIANSGGIQSQTFSTANLDFMIPSSQNDNVFIDTRNTTLSGRMVFTMTTAPVTTNGVFALIGSAASFFDSLTLYSNNVPIEQIFNYNLI